MLAAILDFTILKLFQSCLPRSIGIAEPENIGIDVNIVRLVEFNDKLKLIQWFGSHIEFRYYVVISSIQNVVYRLPLPWKPR